MINGGIISSPLNWYGGKGGTPQRKILREILSYINDCEAKTFVDVFGGSGIVSINIKKDFRIYNDINSNLVNFFNVLKDDKMRSELVEKLTLTLYSEEEYRKAQKNLMISDTPIDRALNFYIATMQSVDEIGSMNLQQSWKRARNIVRRGMPINVSSWLRNIDENLPDSIESLRELQVTREHAEECIDHYIHDSDVVFYLDPPYIAEERVSKNVYENEFSPEDHKRLIEKVLSIKGKAIISGYDCAIYNKLLEHGWTKKTFSISTTASILTIASARKKKPTRVEVIWYK